MVRQKHLARSTNTQIPKICSALGVRLAKEKHKVFTIIIIEQSVLYRLAFTENTTKTIIDEPRENHKKPIPSD